MNFGRISACVVLCWLIGLIAGCRPASNGRAAFERSQQVALRSSHFTVEVAQSTEIGEFKDTKSIDCDAQYFHELDVKDLNDVGVERDRSLSAGRASRHRASEMMFLDGKTYGRNTSSWEDPPLGTDDASPDWHPLTSSRDPREECQSMRAGLSLGFVAYDKILKSAKIDYLGGRVVNGHKCAEYQTSYPNRTYTDTKICLGTKDDLPYQVVGDNFKVTYNYDVVQKVALTENTSIPPSQ